MYTDIVAVALRTVRHNDRTSILTAWSPTLGRLSLVMPAGNGHESKRRRALTMPLSLFEGVVDVRGTAELYRVRDVRVWSPGEGRRSPDVASHPVRATVAMFVAEVLSVATREGDADPNLWSLVVETAQRTGDGTAHELANLPVAFLLRLGAVLGIEPDFTEYRGNRGLDMLEGVFRVTRPSHDDWIGAEESRPLAVFAASAAGYRHLGLVRLPRKVRARLLEGILRYYALHHYPLDKLRSLDILKAVFSA